MKSAIVGIQLVVVVTLATATVAVAKMSVVETKTSIKGLDESKVPPKGHFFTPGVCGLQFPEEFKRDLNYYLTGYDFEHRPVVYWEVGRWKLQKWADFNETTRALAYAYIENFWCRMSNLTSPFEDAEDGIMLVLDLAGFNPAELFSVEVNKMYTYQMRLAESFGDLIAEVMIINANFVSSSWLNLVRPVAGRLVGRMDVYGIGKAKWLSILRGKMEDGAIPPWLLTGKNRDRKQFQPLQTW